MNTKICAILAAAISTLVALGQTNSTVEYRIVRNVTYDVSKPPFISVTIPAGTALLNEGSIHYAPNKTPNVPTILKIAVFQIPAIYDPHSSEPVTMAIHDFPYYPKYFKRGTLVRGTTRATTYNFALDPLYENGLVTKEPIALRLFQAQPAKTNYDALGAMKLIPAKPDFIYGKPVKPVQ
jgi:hypothetical protein